MSTPDQTKKKYIEERSTPFELRNRTFDVQRVICSTKKRKEKDGKKKVVTLITQGNSGGMLKSNKGKGKSGGNAQADNGPTRLDDGGVGETATQIPGQMAKAVHAVVGEREGQSSLESNLGGNRKSTHGGNHRGGLKVPANGGREQVCGSPQVKRAGHDNAGDTVQGGADPTDLGLIDSQMGRDGAVETLLGQKGGWVLGVGGGGGRSRIGCKG